MHSRTLAGAAAAAALAVSSAATATDDFHGIWRGIWDNGTETELTVVDIDDQGRALGAYCHLTGQGRTTYFDLHPEDAIRAQVDDGLLRIKHHRRYQHWSFRPEDGIVRMAVRSGDRQPREIDLERVEEQTCAARVHQLTPPPGATTGPSVADLIPDEPKHWAVGAWTASDRKLTVELTVLDVVDGYAQGTYCNLRPGPTFGFYDVGPNAVRAKVSRTKLKFRIRDIQFSFKRDKDPDILKRTRRQKGKTQRHDVHRTTEPACASRLTPR